MKRMAQIITIVNMVNCELFNSYTPKISLFVSVKFNNSNIFDSGYDMEFIINGD